MPASLMVLSLAAANIAVTAHNLSALLHLV